MAQFSYESLLKQEEALRDLNSSIDDWVTKRDRAETRRTRVRQKLLEHVAAALMLERHVSIEKEEKIYMCGMQLSGQCTPVHSSTITHNPTPCAAPINASTSGLGACGNFESIRDRVDGDSALFALLAVVEDKINRMTHRP